MDTLLVLPRYNVLSFWYKGDDFKVTVFDSTNNTSILSTGWLGSSSDWKYEEFTFDKPAICNKVALIYSINSASGVVKLNGMILDSLELSNAWMENFTNGIADGWSISGSPTVAYSTESHSGIYSWDISSSGINDYIYRTAYVNKDSFYTVQGYVKGTGNLMVQVVNGGTVVSKVSQLYTVWNKFVMSIRAESDSLTIRFYSSGQFKIDDLSVIKLFGDLANNNISSSYYYIVKNPEILK